MGFYLDYLWLIAGILKWIMPGKDGILSSYRNTGYCRRGSRRLDQYAVRFGKVDGFNFGSFAVAVIGALVVLFIYRDQKLKLEKR